MPPQKWAADGENPPAPPVPLGAAGDWERVTLGGLSAQSEVAMMGNSVNIT